MNCLKLSFFFFIFSVVTFYFMNKPKYTGVSKHKFHEFDDLQIHREKDTGIPHIKGKTMTDTCFGQGFVHAQDRLFQMHQKRVFASGRLAEFVGPKVVDVDKYMRELGLKRVAEESLKTLNQETRKCLSAYSKGVNHLVKTLKVMPIEFKISGMVWEDWTEVDSIVQSKLLTLMVTVDHIYEQMRTQLAQVVNEEKAREYFGVGGEYQFIDTVILNDQELKDAGIFEKYKKQESLVDVGKLFEGITFDPNQEDINQNPGSNSWVIHGDLTYSGKPIVANDPHLPNNIPTIWYQNEMLYELNGEQKYVIGVSIPGMPNVFIGKTDKHAWGVTILFADISDLYLEEVNFEQKTYKVGKEDRKLESVVETIKIKGQEPLQYEVYKTHRGPLLNYKFDKNMAVPFQKTKPMSFAWVGQNTDTFHDPLIRLSKANTTEELVKVAHDMPGPGCTVVYATVDDDIGFIGVGNKPIRKNQRSGAFLNLGTRTEEDWQGFADPKDWPQIVNPKKGYVVTANNRFATDNIKNAHSLNQFSTSRASRLEEMFEGTIKNGEKFTIDHMKAFQADTTDIYVARVLPNLLKLYKKTGRNILKQDSQKSICDKLVSKLDFWNFKIDPESVEASIYSVWFYIFQGKIFQKFIPDEAQRKRFTESLHMDPYLYRKLEEFGNNLDQTNISEEWCQTTTENNCLVVLYESLAETQDYLNDHLGGDWRQGTLHKQLFPHAAFSKTPLKPMFDRQIRGFGNHRTLAVAIQRLNFDSFDSAYGANYRQIVDFNEGAKSYWVLDTGISESPFSEYYDNQLPLHENFEYLEMKFGHERFNEYELKLKLIQDERNYLD